MSIQFEPPSEFHRFKSWLFFFRHRDGLTVLRVLDVTFRNFERSPSDP